MKQKCIKGLFFVGLLLCSWQSAVCNEYDARIAKKEILTPLPGKQPAINGPQLYGARPSKKFLYRIPCQGERPIKFSVKGLPAGMSVDKEGIITGVTPEKRGVYTLDIKAQNKYGTATRSFKLLVGDKLALTPPTGWNTWGGYMLCVSDSMMRSVADFFVEKGLADVGYQYLGIDDCWMRISPEQYANLSESKKKQHEGFDYSEVIGEVRDKNGNILPNKKFPDMKGMVDYIHSKGLKVGLYSSPGTGTCQLWTGSYGHEKQDADQYAQWGFDLLKYDICTGSSVLNERRKINPTYSQADFWRPMSIFLKDQDRDILFNLCQYGNEAPWKWAPALGIETWRSTGDLNHHVERYFDSALRIATELAEYAKPGQWHDPDFMYINQIRDYRRMLAPVVEIPLNTNQRYQYVTLWSMICAPYFFSCNIETMDEFTLRLLSNPHLLNINQDELGKVAKVIRNNGKEVIMLKELADGSKALAVFNRDGQNERRISVNWSEFDECCERDVYDAWRMKPLGVYRGGIETLLSPNGVALYIIN